MLHPATVYNIRGENIKHMLHIQYEVFGVLLLLVPNQRKSQAFTRYAMNLITNDTAKSAMIRYDSIASDQHATTFFQNLDYARIHS